MKRQQYQPASGKRVFFACRRHGKLTYVRRGDAKAAARRLHDSGMREYECTAHPGCWHIGHTPPIVIRGEMTADEWYALHPNQRAAILRREARKEKAADRSPDPPPDPS
jgi:hypothetical protein